MKLELNLQVLLAALLPRNRIEGKFRTGLWLLIGLIVLSVSWIITPANLHQVFGVFVAASMLAYWSGIVHRLMQQNHPTLARLLPGQTIELRRSLLASWSVVILVSGMAVGWGFSDVPTYFALLIVILLASCVAVLVYDWRMWLIFWLLLAGVDALILQIEFVRLWQLSALIPSLFFYLVDLLITLFIGRLLPRLIGEGDERHVSAYLRQIEFAEYLNYSFTTTSRTLSVSGRIGEMLNSFRNTLVVRWLNYSLRHAKNRKGKVLGRVELILYGRHHWLSKSMSVFMLMGLSGVGFLALLRRPELVLESVQAARFGLAIGLATVGFVFCLNLPAALWHTRREQALLMLLPGMPIGAAINPALAKRQIIQLLITWGLTILLTTGLCWSSSDYSLVALCVLSLPISLSWLLNRLSRLASPKELSTVSLVLAYLLGSLATFLAVLNQHWSVWLLLLSSIAVSTIIGYWRWNKLLTIPAILPAGRIS